MGLIPVDLCLIRKSLNKRIRAVAKCCNKEMSLMYYTGFIIDHTWQCVTYPVNE